MCIKCQFHWTCTLPSTHILYIFRKIYLDFFQKEIPNPNILKFVLKWGYTNTKYYQIYRGVSDTNTNSTKYTLETPNNPKYKFFMVIWKTKCQALMASQILVHPNFWTWATVYDGRTAPHHTGLCLLYNQRMTSQLRQHWQLWLFDNSNIESHSCFLL